jgi:hypothetical protein
VTALADRLAEAIERADLAGVAAVLAPLDEAQRAVLAPLAAAAFWRYLKMVTAPTTEPRDASDTSHACTTAATVAWLGTGDYPDFPPHRETGSPDWYTQSLFTHAFDTEELHRVLVDRRPHWLPALADRYLASCYWDQVHALIMTDVLARPTSPAYLRGLALYAGRRRDLAAIVDEDPVLLAVDLPALFDLPNGLLLIVRNHQWRGDRWRWVLTAQLPVGHALRDRILDGVLDLLATDRPAGEAAELHQFLDALAPTPDELAARRRVLFTLVAHRQPGVVSYGVRRLKRLARAGLVPLAYLARRAVPEHRRRGRALSRPGFRVARHGRAVVEYIGSAPEFIEPDSRFLGVSRSVGRAFAALGPADESWAYADVEPVAEVGAGTLVASNIALPLGYGNGITVVTDRRGRQRVADLVTDPEAKQRILDTDLKKQTILQLNGVAALAAIRGARLTELAAPDGEKPGYLLELDTDGLCCIPSVVFAIPKLPARPTEIDIHDSASPYTRHPMTVFDARSPWYA